MPADLDLPQYNPDEVFAMAEQIERNGARFYRTAAAREDIGDLRFVLNDLAQQEEEHESLFAQIRSQFAEDSASVASYDMDGIVEDYLRTLAGSYVFNAPGDADDPFDGIETIVDILTVAIQKEKDSIVLYSGIIESMSSDDDRDRVRSILTEEFKHLVTLSSIRRES